MIVGVIVGLLVLNAAAVIGVYAYIQYNLGQMNDHEFRTSEVENPNISLETKEKMEEGYWTIAIFALELWRLSQPDDAAAVARDAVFPDFFHIRPGPAVRGADRGDTGLRTGIRPCAVRGSAGRDSAAGGKQRHGGGGVL